MLNLRSGPITQADIDRQYWFHSFDFGNGLVAKGAKSLEYLKGESEAILGPIDLAGRSVLDIGTFNGHYAFEAERRGAARVVAADKWEWRHELGSRESFEIAHHLKGSAAEPLEIDPPEITTAIGKFDVVLYLGVFYHLIEPIFCTRRIAECATRLMIVETHIDALDNPKPAMNFYPGAELNNDPSNWWGPNPSMIFELMRACGFERIYFREHSIHGKRGVFYCFRTQADVDELLRGTLGPEWQDLTGCRIVSRSAPGRHVLFLHIPKTGGVSVETMIRTHDGPVAPAHAANFMLETDWTKLSRYKYFMGHLPFCIVQLLPRPLFTFTIMRDPVDREISNYNQILRLPPEEPVLQRVVADQVDFVTAMTHPITVPYMGNIVTRMLGIDIDMRSLWPDANAMGLAIKLAWDAPLTEETYQRAVARLDEMDFVGFTERLEQDCCELARLLGFGDALVPFENAEPKDYAWPLPKAARSTETEAAVRTYSNFDCRLYEEVRRRFWHAGGKRRTAGYAIAEQARVLADKYQAEPDQTRDPNVRMWLARILQLEADRDEKLEWAKSYKLLADSLELKVREIEGERDQKFEWAQSYRQSAEGAQQRIRELEADRDKKFAWAQNYRQAAEDAQQRIRELEADRDEKFVWASNYRALSDSLASQLEAETARVAVLALEADDARAEKAALARDAAATRAELAGVTSSRTFRLASALASIWRRLRLR
jgi:tRNA (mo5U34)-methyltransferase